MSDPPVNHLFVKEDTGLLSHPTSQADLDRRASDLIDAMLAFRWACDSTGEITARALSDVCTEAADLVTFCLARHCGADDGARVARALGDA